MRDGSKPLPFRRLDAAATESVYDDWQLSPAIHTGKLTAMPPDAFATLRVNKKNASEASFIQSLVSLSVCQAALPKTNRTCASPSDATAGSDPLATMIRGGGVRRHFRC